MLLGVVPALALLAGLAIYLAGGRYISTDNASVGAQKVLVTPDISGKTAAVLVKEGQHVAAGDALFEIDPTPFRLALTQAQGKLDSVRTDFNNLKSNLKSLDRLVELAHHNVALTQKNVERKSTLLAKSTGSSTIDGRDRRRSCRPGRTAAGRRPRCSAIPPRSDNIRPISRPRRNRPS
jgi:membrane fusion protein (multidrug efflux system)